MPQLTGYGDQNNSMNEKLFNYRSLYEKEFLVIKVGDS